MGSRLGQRASKGACLVVPTLFRADSGTNLIKQGENVKGRPCGSVAQLAECSHGKREALGSCPGRATIFSSPVTHSMTMLLLAMHLTGRCRQTRLVRGQFSWCYTNLS